MASLRPLMQPLTLAGLCTLAGVALSLRWLPEAERPPAFALLGAFALAFALSDAAGRRAAMLGHALLVLQPALALALLHLTPEIGTAQVLLVVWAASIAMEWPLRLALFSVIVADAVAWALLRWHGHDFPLTVTLLYAGFQGFAALTAHYARSAEHARDALARVNADLLATRALLAEGARDAERLRLARELHDVAGHKLTAQTLQLRALLAEPGLARREEVATALRLSQELLGDLRGVVQALRTGEGLDLHTALRALAAPFPKPRLQLDIADDVRIADPALAETVLRIVQEALTNSARHADAETVRVALSMREGALRVVVEDDGHLRGTMREGNGLAGMRERIAARGGALTLGSGAHGGLRLDASLPA